MGSKTIQSNSAATDRDPTVLQFFEVIISLLHWPQFFDASSRLQDVIGINCS